MSLQEKDMPVHAPLSPPRDGMYPLQRLTHGERNVLTALMQEVNKRTGCDWVLEPVPVRAAGDPCLVALQEAVDTNEWLLRDEIVAPAATYERYIEDALALLYVASLQSDGDRSAFERLVAKQPL